ncbi:1-acyl-sn-glycerol-3-phosphate acyltransferase [Sphingobacterium allocomposti]|jgi:1-acyl-sn-glycerol-3-phosphate acyltransferase|uniref:1-acyl-sn-glycerol-3-phosphate acyltransferase n=1 Tax=Sphingobacterium allocomposti TaxID=415956 RepID=A0A5S5D636_9SPHI|nr:lysophospholipid acyltransferase family protein [Sphingobacterium composti Yoo et al. 2007 non Ten et al. 2007]TYP91527.1 1-acyl-sn-glycerol-3-phosphate acyltransferase [Sphingobacterium composti Yoo et al. 2007 non Ten et al. 2007]HLS94188.1 lysophospholipid acyltransferase family protein [Sphingobacterium sp.]
MRKLLGFILTPIFYLCFSLSLIVFHPIQWLCLKLGGYRAHKKSVDILNGFLVACNYTLFNRTRFIDNKRLPIGRPIIFVANHQSTFDIPPLIYFLRRFHGKFISKIELAQAGIPSISFNLVHGGAANIDRKDAKQSIAEILKLANNMKMKNWSAFIFPEGTRTKTGKMKPFSVGGIATLLKKNPEALVVPVAIKGSYLMVKYGMFPLRPFTSMSWEVLDPIDTTGLNAEEIVKKAEEVIRVQVEG